jgi:cytochrome o ubiquinol oxidase operon protein cyoD
MNSTRTLWNYIIGYVLSIGLTLVAYFVIVNPGWFNVAAVAGNMTVLEMILGLAVIQLIVQMLFFLHIGAAAGRGWRLGIFFSTLALVLIIVVGSIWIMNHLNYNMTPAQIDQYMQDQQGGF